MSDIKVLSSYDPDVIEAIITDADEATLTEAINGEFVFTLQLPAHDSTEWAELSAGRYIRIDDDQLFDIVRLVKKRERDGTISATAVCEHVSYRLIDVDVEGREEEIKVFRVDGEIVGDNTFYLDGDLTAELGTGDEGVIWGSHKDDGKHTIVSVEYQAGIDMTEVEVESFTGSVFNGYFAWGYAFINATATAMLEKIVDGTDFTVGTVEPTEAKEAFFEKTNGRVAARDIAVLFGAELEWDNFTINLLTQRGGTGPPIEVGVNTGSLEDIYDVRDADEEVRGQMDVAELEHALNVGAAAAQGMGYPIELGDEVNVKDVELGINKTLRVVVYEREVLHPAESKVEVGNRINRDFSALLQLERELDDVEYKTIRHDAQIDKMYDEIDGRIQEMPVLIACEFTDTTELTRLPTEDGPTYTDIVNATDPEQVFYVGDRVLVLLENGQAKVVDNLNLPRYQDDTAAAEETGAYEVEEWEEES